MPRAVGFGTLNQHPLHLIGNNDWSPTWQHQVIEAAMRSSALPSMRCKGQQSVTSKNVRPTFRYSHTRTLKGLGFRVGEDPSRRRRTELELRAWS